MEYFFPLLAVAFSCGALFKLGDSIADLVIVFVKYLWFKKKRK